MKFQWKCMIFLLSVIFLLSGCTRSPKVDENGFVTVTVSKISEQQEINLDHPLYNCREWEFSFEVYGSTSGKVLLEEYEYLQNLEYEKEDIQSAEQALNYYQSIDPWDLITKRNYVVAEIQYDADYDVWCMILCKEDRLDDFNKFTPTASWWVYFKGNGEFLYRLG